MHKIQNTWRIYNLRIYSIANVKIGWNSTFSNSAKMEAGTTQWPQHFLAAHAAWWPLSPFRYTSINCRDHVRFCAWYIRHHPLYLLTLVGNSRNARSGLHFFKFWPHQALLNIKIYHLVQIEFWFWLIYGCPMGFTYFWPFCPAQAVRIDQNAVD